MKNPVDLIELSALAIERFDENYLDNPENVVVPEDQSDLEKLRQMLSCLKVASTIEIVDGKKALCAFAAKGQVHLLMEVIAKN